jgi:hypothetical protein
MSHLVISGRAAVKLSVEATAFQAKSFNPQAV